MSDAFLTDLRGRLRERADFYRRGLTHDELCALCATLDERLLNALHERDVAHAKLAKVRQELAATPECDCGTCLACRVADVVGA